MPQGRTETSRINHRIRLKTFAIPEYNGLPLESSDFRKRAHHAALDQSPCFPALHPYLHAPRPRPLQLEFQRLKPGMDPKENPPCSGPAAKAHATAMRERDRIPRLHEFDH